MPEHVFFPSGRNQERLGFLIQLTGKEFEALLRFQDPSGHELTRSISSDQSLARNEDDPAIGQGDIAPRMESHALRSLHTQSRHEERSIGRIQRVSSHELPTDPLPGHEILAIGCDPSSDEPRPFRRVVGGASYKLRTVGRSQHLTGTETSVAGSGLSRSEFQALTSADGLPGKEFRSEKRLHGLSADELAPQDRVQELSG